MVRCEGLRSENTAFRCVHPRPSEKNVRDQLDTLDLRSTHTNTRTAG